MRIALLAAALLAAAPALAQTATPWVDTDDDTVIVEPFGLNADEMEGLTIVDASGQIVGEVDDVLMNPEGQAGAVAADLDGPGDRSVVIEFASLTLDGQQLRADLSREDIDALPAYDD